MDDASYDAVGVTIDVVMIVHWTKTVGVMVVSLTFVVMISDGSPGRVDGQGVRAFGLAVRQGRPRTANAPPRVKA